ncbi:MAG: hypothetical protein DRJ60_05115, partial [Thermoprotei archaeon]
EERKQFTAKVAYGNGTFEFEVPLTVDTDTVSENDGTLQVEPVDTVYIYFTDNVSATGAAKVVSLTVSVKSETGKIELDKSAYLPGDYVTIRVTDIDQNVETDVVDRISITIATTSYPVGLTIDVPETGVNTGVFETKIKLVALEDWTPGAAGQVPVEIGDTITVTYVDSFNASGEEEKVTAEAMVGAVVEYPVPSEAPQVVDPTTGEPIANVTAGSMVSIAANITNKDVIPHSFVYIVQVKNAQGVIVKLDWISGTIEADATMTPAVSWTPTEPGTYTIEVYVVQSLAVPEPLSLVQTQVITVS